MLAGIVVKGAAFGLGIATRPQSVCYLFPFGKDVPFCKHLRGLGCDGAAMSGSFCLLPLPMH